MVSDYRALSHQTAEAIAEQLRQKPDSRLGLPTGMSPLGCYAFLAAWSKSDDLDWSQTNCFALDDYLDADDEHTFAYYLEQNLYQHTNLPKSGRHNPSYIQDYDHFIAQGGGLDLTIVGIGSNGHIAFNEPGTVRQSWTHCVWLTDSTRQANSAYFGSLEKVPHRAITMGIATILACRKLILIATGEHKQDIIRKALFGPITPDIPASFLQKHNNLQVITDFKIKK